jgi:regulator of replication initiation timing
VTTSSAIKITLGLLAAMLLAACQTDQPPVIVDIAPLSSQIGNLAQSNSDLRAANERLTQANVALQEENERLKAIVRSDARAGKRANEVGKVRFEAFVWDHLIKLLPGAEDEETTQRWKEAWEAFIAGNESSLQGIISDLSNRADASNVVIGKLQKEVEQLSEERDLAREAAKTAQEAVNKAKVDLAYAVKKAVQSERVRLAAETRAWQVHVANVTGSVLLTFALGLVAVTLFLPVAKKKFKEGAGVAFALCIGCFALARFLGSSWFWPVAGSLYGITGAAWLAWKIRTGLRTEPMEVVAPVLIEELDKLYDNPDNREWMDTKLFPALESRGAAYDAAVKRIKAIGLLIKKK